MIDFIQLGVLGLLGVSAWEDYKHGEIPFLLIDAWILAALVAVALAQDYLKGFILLGSVLLGFKSGELIGIGGADLVCMAGLLCLFPLVPLLYGLVIAFGMSAMAASYLKFKGVNRPLRFLPFLFLGMSAGWGATLIYAGLQ